MFIHKPTDPHPPAFYPTAPTAFPDVHSQTHRPPPTSFLPHSTSHTSLMFNDNPLHNLDDCGPCTSLEGLKGCIPVDVKGTCENIGVKWSIRDIIM
jgi:hypothetical protein